MSHQKLVLQPGKRISYQGRSFRIVQLLSLQLAELIAEDNHEIINASITELQAPEAEAIKRPDLTLIDDKAWETARYRMNVIKPLLNLPSRTREQVAAHGQKHSVSTNTLYGWIKAYESSGVLSSLLPKTRRDKGMTKLSSEVEEIIRESMATDFLTLQKKSVQKLCDEIIKRCMGVGLEPPHDNTIRNRVKALSPEIVVSQREGRKKADLSFKPHKGSFPGADWPLSVVQIDHTKLDIILVDDHYRQPIGRPWITLAFDVYSRMVTGFYVSFDPPSALSTGLCLAHSILPKDKWLAQNGIKSEWPVWGLPTTIHVDNAKEFRGEMLQKACDEYNINIEWRPVGRPNFGAHVERALGTFSKEIHTLPGTTFSNTHTKGDYKSEKHAALTLSEFESWLSIYIADVYHQKIHSALGAAPIDAYKKGILGDEQQPGCGLPPKITNEDRLRLDFMPFELRTVQDYGVVVEEIHYYHDVLRHWMNAPDPKDGKRKRKFTFRCDPRDISVIWFFDPEIQTYYPIPYRDTSHPAISIWELREAKNKVTSDKRRHMSERSIFDAYDRMREIETEALAKSKAARRANQRRIHHQQVEKPLSTTSTVKSPEPECPVISDLTPAIPDIMPFDEMDDLL
ncbi:Mu transposase C-terminal domain-containing protein [Aeromonas caviae]|uniref:Mu transposase C-terminal domain-containing protein n=1 Tax=Aeromonas caviae TaxID=648 RepID=UPI002B49AEDE|nr:Mu transposase C-terminal domain-containing protein [Aeromonas caviae]